MFVPYLHQNPGCSFNVHLEDLCLVLALPIYYLGVREMKFVNECFFLDRHVSLTLLRNSEIHCSTGHLFPKLVCLPYQLIHTFSCQGRRTLSSLRGRQIQLARCHMTHMLKWNKRAYIEPETEKHFHTRCKLDTDCVGSLYIYIYIIL